MDSVTLSNCKTAELHLVAEVQSFGALVCIDMRTQLISACSANIREFTGVRAEDLLGANWSKLFRAEQVSSLFNSAASTSASDSAHLPQIVKAQLNERTVLIANHCVNNTALVEIEPCLETANVYDFRARVAYLHALGQTDTPEQAATLLMQSVAQLIGYDRAMLYKFLPDWHGEVLAESLRPGVAGFLGLRFPASDIPANARRLYAINLQRVIPDVAAVSIPVLTAPGCEPLDLSYSQLRAVHPVHIQYLKNIGTEASFSLSILVAGRLWGLIACHHLAPKGVSLEQRQVLEELSRTTGMQMTLMNALRLESARAILREALAEIGGALRSDDGDKSSIGSQLARIRHAFKAQGILAQLDDRDFCNGDIPDEVSLSALRNWLEAYDKSAVTAAHSISPALAKYPALVRFASGILYVPLGSKDFLLLMRTEQIELVQWAGRPQDQPDTAAHFAALTPRASFQAWSERVQGSAEPWHEAELEAAEKLRVLLLAHIERVQLESWAFRDPLTGLANRLMFDKALQGAIKLSIRQEVLSAVFMLDLDRFKPVNDALGHAAGDELLIQVAQRLKGAMRERDVVARLGGDEFAIIQFHLASTQDADRTAERVLAEIRRPFILRGQSVEIGVSIGVSMCPINAVDQDELLEDADLALYEAKRAGRNTFKAFTRDMQPDKERLESVRQSLVDAMRNGAMRLEYQPLLSAQTRVLQSFEAFARWDHPARGALSARAILPLLEQYHLLNPFAEWGIREVLRQGKQWLRKGLPLVPISLNLSATQFLSVDLVGVCTSLSKELEIGLEWLRFDLEVAAFQVDFQRTADKVAALAQLGVLTNIGQFGEGLVALNRFVDVKINKLKVPGKYFSDDTESQRHAALVAIVRSIGQVLRAPIVATQIENAVMEARALAAGVEYLQGRHIGVELTPQEVEHWLGTRSRVVQAASGDRPAG